ncbi:MAG TPA: hypothetical protein VGB26_15155 [Nitrospiria bacterium]|jgi:hypothetical protein
MKEWTVLHKNYQTGEIREIGRVIERRIMERGNNFLDLIRKARLNYGRRPFDIGAIFLGNIIGEVRNRQKNSRHLRLISDQKIQKKFSSR